MTETLQQAVARAKSLFGIDDEDLAELIGLDSESLPPEDNPEVRHLLSRLLGEPTFPSDSDSANPLVALFRAANEDLDGAIPDLLADRSLFTLGDFVSSQRDLGALEQALGESRSVEWLDTFPSRGAPSKQPHAEGLELARRARNTLPGGPLQGPIPSMLGLMESLGIEVVWADDGALSPAIDAASVMAPGPAILLNAQSGPWWRMRMTLAHELCHLLYDRAWLGSDRPMLMMTPRREEGARKRRPRLTAAFSSLVEIEQRANAFAAYFLAPPDEVRKLVAACATEAEARRRVCSHFGIGWITAGHQIRNSSIRRFSFSSSAGKDFEPDHAKWREDQPDRLPRVRRGRLAELVGKALRRGLASKLGARLLLDLEMTDPLPESVDVPETLRAPVVTLESLARRRVLSELLEAHPEIRARLANFELEDDGAVFDLLDANGASVGTARVSDDDEVSLHFWDP